MALSSGKFSINEAITDDDLGSCQTIRPIFNLFSTEIFEEPQAGTGFAVYRRS
jgi:hypothetical protein